MEIKIIKNVTSNLKPQPGSVSIYRKSPSDLNAALWAAVHYANKQQKDLAVVQGNSYMSVVYQIVEVTVSAVKGVTVMTPKNVPAFIVSPQGDITRVELTA